MTNSAARIVDWLETSRRLLSGLGGGLEAGHLGALLVSHVLAKPRAWVLAHPETPLTQEQQNEIEQLVARLGAGEPLPYLLGRWPFFELSFRVSPAVLIPRPETELLVEHALGWLRDHPGRRAAADVGTGSGCIAISLARRVPDLRMLAVDRSAEALALARQNAQEHESQAQVTFVRGNLLSAVRGPLDLVCANLPYIPSNALADLPVAQHEPRLALDGGQDGLEAIRALIEDAPRWLAPGGLLLLEMQFDQGDALRQLAQAVLPGARVDVQADLAGLPRLVAIERDGTVGQV